MESEGAAVMPQTVTGDPLRDDYELVLAHEHLIGDIRCYLDEDCELAGLPVTPELRPRLLKDPMGCADNLVLDDRDAAAEELSVLRDVRTLVVDVTPDSIGRDPAGLAIVSRQAGVDLVMGCGPYVELAYSDEDRDRSSEEWSRQIVDQLRRPAPRSSVIGEVGTSDPISDGERRALVGAIWAQRETGVPLYVHLHPFGRQGHAVLSLVEQHGGDLSRTVLCHLDGQIPDGLDYHRELLDRGCLIAFDVWGYEAPELGGRFPSDEERAAATVELAGDGYAEGLLHSQDVCMKLQLRRFGGPGYDPIWSTVRPALLAAGLSPATVADMLAGNALRLLGARAKTR